MNTKQENALDNFIDDEKSFEKKVAEQKKKFLKNGNGLIERIDKIYLTENDKQLLCE